MSLSLRRCVAFGAHSPGYDYATLEPHINGQILELLGEHVPDGGDRPDGERGAITEHVHSFEAFH
jgi:hypothetical protein